MIIGSRHHLTKIENSPVLTLGGNNVKRVFQKVTRHDPRREVKMG